MGKNSESPNGVNSRAKDLAKRAFRHENAILVTILVVIVAVFAFWTKGFSVTRANISNILLQSSIRGVASIGQAFVILTANFDLSVGGVATMAALLGATTMTSNLEQNVLGTPLVPGAALSLMLVAGLGIGAINGLAVSRLRMPALIVTLAMWQITNGISYQLGQGLSVMGLPTSVSFVGNGEILGVPVPIIIFITIAVICYLVLTYTTFGRSVYACGSSPVSAYLSGVKVNNVLLYVYLIAGFLAAIAGIITMSRTMSGSMEVATGLELDSIAAVVVGGVSLSGGRGNLIGVVVGVIIIGVVNNGMIVAGLDPFLHQVVKGIIIISAVAIDAIRRREATNI